MATYTLETPRGRRLTIEAQSDADAMALADRWDLEDHASSEAQRLGVSPDLVLRQMHVESGGNPKAVSPKGARGPMQLMPATAKELGVDPDDPYQNITGGVTYLRKQLDAFGGDEARALAAYNAGPAAVRKAGGVPNYPETRKYVAALANKTPPQQQATAAAAVPVNPRKDQALGFQKGVMTPLDNLATWVEKGAAAIPQPLADAMSLTPFGPAIQALKAAPAAGKAMGMPTAAQAKQDHANYVAAQRAKGVVPGRIGEFAGNVVGTLPTAMLPGGILAQGAASGALLSDAKGLPGIATDAAIGAAGAKLGDMALKGVGKAAAKALRPKAMNPAELTAAKDAAYQAVDNMGVQYKPGPFNGLIGVIDQEVKASPVYDPLSHTKVNSALAKIDSLQGKSPTFQEVENLRKFIRGNVVDGGGSTAEQSVGKLMLRQVDDFLEAMRPAHVVSGDPVAAVQGVKTARDLARRDFLTKDLQAAIQAAQDRAAVSSTGGNIDNALRQEVRKVLQDNPNVTGAEREAIEAAFKGDALGNLMRLVGRLSPTTGGLSAMMNVGAAMTNPLLGIPGLVGAGAKTAADMATRGRINEAMRVVAGGKESAAAPIIQAATRFARPVVAGAGAAAATNAAAEARRPVVQDWPEGAVMQDASGSFYDAAGRPVR